MVGILLYLCKQGERPVRLVGLAGLNFARLACTPDTTTNQTADPCSLFPSLTRGHAYYTAAGRALSLHWRSWPIATVGCCGAQTKVPSTRSVCILSIVLECILCKPGSRSHRQVMWLPLAIARMCTCPSLYHRSFFPWKKKLLFIVSLQTHAVIYTKPPSLVRLHVS